MGLIETTLSRDYQPEWGLKQALREIVSNAIDGEKKGMASGTGKMCIEYSKRRKVLTVSNEDTRVPTKALLMGESGSREHKHLIGQFGEGLPLSLLVLARSGMPVTIFNGTEKWEPLIHTSKFYGAEVLAIKTREMITERTAFVVEIGDIEPDEAQAMTQMFLRLDPEFDAVKHVISVPYSDEKVLVGVNFRGRVYNKGVFVCKRDDLLFGYDLADQSINRDRSIVDEHELKYAINRALNAAVEEHPEDFAQIVIGSLLDNPNALENQAQYSALRYNVKFRDAVLCEWCAHYGAKTVAVANGEEVRQAELLGLKAVVAPPLLLALINDSVGTFSQLKELHGNEVTEYPALTEFEQRAKETLERVFARELALESMSLAVVKFVLASTMVSQRGNEICISQAMIGDVRESCKAVALELGKLRAQRQGTRAMDEQLNLMAAMLIRS